MWITFEFFLNYVENTRNPEQVGIYLMLYSSVLQDTGKKCVFFAFCGNIDGDSSVTGAQHREKPRRGIFRKTPDTKDPGHDVMIIGKGM